MTLQERCAEGFDNEDDEDGLTFCTVEDEDEDEDFSNIWDEVYREEMEVMNDERTSGTKEMLDAIKAIEAREKPGPGSFSDVPWGRGGDSPF